MEEGLFLDEEVSKVLRERFVEARIHTDIRGEKGEPMRAVQKRFAGTRANPVYVNLEPKSETPSARVVGLKSKEEFLEFLFQIN